MRYGEEKGFRGEIHSMAWFLHKETLGALGKRGKYTHSHFLMEIRVGKEEAFPWGRYSHQL
jgi:hypothetical protein